jgi:MFS family permease
MRTGIDQERDSGAAFELAVGCVAVVVAAFTAAALFSPAEQVARAAVVAVGVAGLAVVLRDWRAWAGGTVFAALVFVGFLAHQAGQLTGDAAPWRYTLIIGFGALLGRGPEWIRAAARPSRVPAVRPLPRRIGDRSVASVQR